MKFCAVDSGCCRGSIYVPLEFSVAAFVPVCSFERRLSPYEYLFALFVCFIELRSSDVEMFNGHVH